MKTTIENKTNEAFIREWFWEHNLYLHGREDKERILNRLIAIVIIFEKLKGINEKDSVIKRDHMILRGLTVMWGINLFKCNNRVHYNTSGIRMN